LLSPASLRHCASVLSYIEEMTAWHDTESEDETRFEYATKVLAQIVRQGRLGPEETAYCEARLAAMFGANDGEG
jgi:hypothetical protein